MARRSARPLLKPRSVTKLLLAALVLAITAPAHASPSSSPYDVVWASLQLGLGRASKLTGDLGDRSERAPCSGGSCSLSPRFAIGGGFGRWAVELHVAATPFTDTGAEMSTTRSRTALLVGPHVRFSVLRRWGFDVSVRSGLELGGIDGDPPTMEFPKDCNPEIPRTCQVQTTDAPTRDVVGLSGGVSIAWRVRFDRGFFGVQADFDVTGVHVAYANGDVYGSLETTTFGFTFGSMVDL